MRLPLFCFFSRNAVAHRAASVVAKHAETCVKYPRFTDRPDHSYMDPANSSDRVPVMMYVQIIQDTQIPLR